MISHVQAHLRSQKRNRNTSRSATAHGYLREIPSKRLKEGPTSSNHLRRRSHSGADVVHKCMQHSAVLPHVRRCRSKSVPTCVGVVDTATTTQQVTLMTEPLARATESTPTSSTSAARLGPSSEPLSPVDHITSAGPEEQRQNPPPDSSLGQPMPLPFIKQPFSYNLDMSGTSLERMKMGGDVMSAEYSATSVNPAQSKAHGTTPPKKGAFETCCTFHALFHHWKLLLGLLLVTRRNRRC